MSIDIERANQAAIEVLLDIYNLTKNKKVLNLTVNIVNSWVNLAGKTGLIPEMPFSVNLKGLSSIIVNQSMKRGKTSRLDSQTDFGIILLKLYELTGNEHFKTASEKIFNSIFTYHFSDKGIFEFVNVETGSNVNSSQIIETKMLTLLMKFPLLKLELSKGKKIFEDKLLRDVLRDR